jgi:glutamyl-tRNA synthetase
MTTICRFAPSPTGFLHVGNIRAAIINFLYAKKTGGKFYLRLDDTDSSRSTDEYRDMIIKDLNWLGLDYDLMFKQSDRLQKYEEAKNALIKSGRLYECYESPEELSLQRKSQAMSGLAPIYNRQALNLTAEQKQKFRDQGLKPHYRFLLEDKEVSWQDKIKGEIKYQGLHFSDPVLVRDNGVPTYTFCSTVDDLEYKITDIIRGEDHITNTAIQIQIFEALKKCGFEGKIPEFSHLALVNALEGKISKRIGGFDVKTLRETGIEPLSLILLLAQIGTSKSIEIYKNLDEIIAFFDFANFSKSSTKYDLDEVKNINQKLLQTLDFSSVKGRLDDLSLNEVDEKLFNVFKANIEILADLKTWLEVCKKQFRYENKESDKDFLKTASNFLPNDTNDENCWQNWLSEIKKNTDRKGKELFMPIRLALSGKEHGPEIKHLVNLISRDEILARLSA